jgi:formylglycine-generating enzyme required for sulfatase activity
MIWVPAGDTVLGSDRFHPEERPKRRAQVGGFWIDPHEVTNAEFAAFVAATATEPQRKGPAAAQCSTRHSMPPDRTTSRGGGVPTRPPPGERREEQGAAQHGPRSRSCR